MSFLVQRIAVSDNTLGDINVKKKTLVNIPVASLLQGIADETEFKPERWLNGEMN